MTCSDASLALGQPECQHLGEYSPPARPCKATLALFSHECQFAGPGRLDFSRARRRFHPGLAPPPGRRPIGWWTRTTRYLERVRARYGTRFTMRLLGRRRSSCCRIRTCARPCSPRRPTSCTPASGARRDPRAAHRPPTPSSCSTRRRTSSSAGCMLPPSTATAGPAAGPRLMAELADARGGEPGPPTRPLALHPRLQAPDARDHPARGVRPRSGRAAGGAARAARPRSSAYRRRRSAAARRSSAMLAAAGACGRFERERARDRPGSSTR